MQVRVWKEEEPKHMQRGRRSAEKTAEHHVQREAEMWHFPAPQREMLPFLVNFCSYNLGYILGNNVLKKY